MPSAVAPIPLTEELAALSARMSGLLLSEETVETSLSLLSSLVHETVPGSCGAGVSVIQDGRWSSAGSTDQRVRAADGCQYELDEGPCLDATAVRELVVIGDLQTERRWPRWAAAVAPMGLRGAASAPMVVGDTTVGAVKVYADEPAAFDFRSEQLLWLFSAQAAVLVANAQSHDRARRLSEGMRQAMRDRDVIGVAKGVLIGRHAVDEDAAVRMLVAHGQEARLTLVDAARAVVASAVGGRRP